MNKVILDLIAVISVLIIVTIYIKKVYSIFAEKKIFIKLHFINEKRFTIIFSICICFLCSVYLTSSYKDYWSVKVGYKAEENSNYLFHLYYGDGNGFSEIESIIKYSDNTGKVKFDIHGKNVNQIRIDTYYEKCEIEYIDIKGIGYHARIDNNNWEYYCDSVYNAERVLSNNNLIEYSTVSEPIMLTINFKDRNLFMELCCYVLLLVVISGILYIISYGIQKVIKYEPVKKEHVLKTITTAFAFYMLVCILVVGVKAIREVDDRSTNQYMKLIDASISNNINGEIDTTFIAHGKNVIVQKFMIQKLSDYSGSLTYQIFDRNGSTIVEITKPVSEIIETYDENWDAISIPCESLNLKWGNEYSIRFTTDNLKIAVICDANGEIQQCQIFTFGFKLIYKFVIIAITFFAILMILLCFNKGLSDVQFLVSAMVFGIIMSFVLAPCSAADEYRHFLRVYDIVNEDTSHERTLDYEGAKGNIIPEADGADIIKVPYELNYLRILDKDIDVDNISYQAETNFSTIIDELIRLAIMSPHAEETYKVSMVGTNHMSPLAYFPQIILAGVAKIIGLNAVWQFYFARIGNALFCAFMAWVCIKLVPQYRNLIILCYFIPYATWTVASCNRDSILIWIIVLFISYVLHLKEAKKSILEFKSLVILSVLSILIATIKLPYILICAIVLILDKYNFTPQMSKLKTNFIKMTLVVAFFAIGFIGYMAPGLISNMLNDDVKIEMNEDNIEVQNEEQVTHMSYAKTHLGEVITSIYNRSKSLFSDDLEIAVNGYFYKLSNMYIVLAFMLLLLCKNRVSILNRIYLLILFYACWFGICSAGYIMAAPDLGYIWGISSRYMIPILPILMLAIMSGNSDTEKIADKLLPTTVLGMVCMDTVSMINFYF